MLDLSVGLAFQTKTEYACRINLKRLSDPGAEPGISTDYSVKKTFSQQSNKGSPGEGDR